MTSPNYPQKLRRQLELLLASCREFDDGNPAKALEIAVRLRVIFHSTRASTSALRHLNAEHVRLLSTATLSKDMNPGRTFISEGGLTVFRGNGLGWVASLDDARNRRQVQFGDWWDSEIVAVYQNAYTRKTVVTDTANKDDGAHIDKALPATRLATLIDGPWQSIERSKGGTTIKGRKPNLHFQYLRQIAYEALHSNELLDLVDVGFRLQTDAQYRAIQRIATSERVQRLVRLHNTAVSLTDSGKLEHSRTILNALNEEIGEHPNATTARIYCRVRLQQAFVLEEDDLEGRLKLLTELCADIKTKIRPVAAPVEYMDVAVRAQFQIGMLHAQQRDRQASEASWKVVRDTAQASITVQDQDDLSTIADPICFYLWSATNIACHAFNNGEYDVVIRELDSTFTFLAEKCAGLVAEWSQEEIENRCGAEFGSEIARSVCKGLRNRLIAQFAVGSRELAIDHFDPLRERFKEATDSEIVRMLSETQAVFNGEIKLHSPAAAKVRSTAASKKRAGDLDGELLPPSKP